MSAKVSSAVRGVAVLITAGAVVVAGNAATAEAATAKTARVTMRVSVSSQHHVYSLTSVHPGLAHLVNTGARPLVLLRKKSKGVAALVADANNETDSADSIRLYKDFGVLDLIAPHADEYVRFVKGTYYLTDASTDRLKSSQVRTITVSGAKRNATAPHATLVRAAGNGTIAASVTMPKHGYVHIVNKAGSPSLIAILSIERSATTQQINNAISDPRHHSPFSLVGSYFAPLGFPGGHIDIYKRVVTGSGRYFLLASPLDRPGLARGQIGLLTVK